MLDFLPAGRFPRGCGEAALCCDHHKPGRQDPADPSSQFMILPDSGHFCWDCPSLSFFILKMGTINIIGALRVSK